MIYMHVGIRYEAYVVLHNSGVATGGLGDASPTRLQKLVFEMAEIR